MSDFSSNSSSFFLYWHHDTTSFFYRHSSKIMADVNESVALHKRRCRTNLKNTELSKHTFRIFLEKQILWHVEIESRNNVHYPQTPLTPIFDYNESNFALNHEHLKLLPFQAIKSGQLSKTNWNSNLEPEKYSSSNRAIKKKNAIFSHDTNSKINVHESIFQNKSKQSTHIATVSNQNISNSKINIVNKDSNYMLIYDNSPEWFQNNEIVSVHGSLVSDSISDISSTYGTDFRRSINHTRRRWKRIFFCCVN